MPDNVAFPLTAIVGQDEMKDALLLAAVNPRVQGVLLIGTKGTGKTTAARGLIPLLPTVEHSTCPFGCEPSMALTHPEELCANCTEKLARGEAISYRDTQKVVELPLNATIDDVVGGAVERNLVATKPAWTVPLRSGGASGSTDFGAIATAAGTSVTRELISPEAAYRS